MTTAQRTQSKEIIGGYGDFVKQHLNLGWQGYMLTLMFHQLRGTTRQMNIQMQHEIENVYASFLTRLHRRPHAAGAIPPILISCPDFPVPKYEKKSLPEVITNDGLHQHGILLIPPTPSRLKVSVQQHFSDNQSYYLRDQVLNRIHIEPVTHDADRLTDYAFKGTKTNRIPDEESILILPSTYRVSARSYRSFEDQ